MYVCIVPVLTTTSPIAHSSERKLKWDHERITIEAMIDTGTKMPRRKLRMGYRDTAASVPCIEPVVSEPVSGPGPVPEPVSGGVSSLLSESVSGGVLSLLSEPVSES